MVLVVGVDVAAGVSAAVRVVVLLLLMVRLRRMRVVVLLSMRVVVLLSMRVVVLLLLLLLVRVRVMVLSVRVFVVLLSSSVGVVMLLSSSVGVVVLLSSVLLLVVSPARDGRRRLPVRQRRVHQVVHGLEQVLDAVGGGNASMTEVRDQLRGDVVHGNVGHRLAALGRAQRRGHLVLEEAGQGGGQGPVALRVGDALVLLLFVLLLEERRGERG